jgi:hypothetical protein
MQCSIGPASRFRDRLLRATLRSGRRTATPSLPALVPGLLAGLIGLVSLASPAEAARPRNPYSSFNLSGVNYGAMQWERAQRQGRRVWPYYNTPSRGATVSRGSTSRSVGSPGGSRLIRSR